MLKLAKNLLAPMLFQSLWFVVVARPDRQLVKISLFFLFLSACSVHWRQDKKAYFLHVLLVGSSGIGLDIVASFVGILQFSDNSFLGVNPDLILLWVALATMYELMLAKLSTWNRFSLAGLGAVGAGTSYFAASQLGALAYRDHASLLGFSLVWGLLFATQLRWIHRQR